MATKSGRITSKDLKSGVTIYAANIYQFGTGKILSATLTPMEVLCRPYSNIVGTTRSAAIAVFYGSTESFEVDNNGKVSSVVTSSPTQHYADDTYGDACTRKEAIRKLAYREYLRDRGIEPNTYNFHVCFNTRRAAERYIRWMLTHDVPMFDQHKKNIILTSLGSAWADAGDAYDTESCVPA